MILIIRCFIKKINMILRHITRIAIVYCELLIDGLLVIKLDYLSISVYA